MHFRCHGCGTLVDPAQRLPFRCPGIVPGDDIDHVLEPVLSDGELSIGSDDNPFLRYRALLSTYQLARAVGLSDAAWIDLVATLDGAVTSVAGRGLSMSPLTKQEALGAVIGDGDAVWIKDETGNVGGSHKARHLMGVMLYLRLVDQAGLPAGANIRCRRLAIASCGNAALSAAIIARAAEWPLDVFVPTEADPVLLRHLRDLGACITQCERQPGAAGDPCVLRFRDAVAAGAIAFSVQGPENGLAIEGGRTLAWEMAEQFRAAGAGPDTLFVQVGGGALASALSQGLELSHRLGLLQKRPRLMTVQTRACAPLMRAWTKAEGFALATATHHRSEFMRPWECAASSLADGILDDETYDWWSVLDGMRETDGHPVLVDESTVARANEIARQHTGIAASPTGTAGLAGAMSLTDRSGVAAFVFSGIDRTSVSAG